MDVAATDGNGQTPLHHAAANGHADTVRVLVKELGADVGMVDADGDTALHSASRKGHFGTARLFVEELGSTAGIRNIWGRTAIHSAACDGHVDVLRVLLAKGLGAGECVDSRDSNEETPLHIAARNGHADTVRCLVKEFGADVGLTDAAIRSFPRNARNAKRIVQHIFVCTFLVLS